MSKNKPLTVSALKAKLELLESVGAINGDTVICRYDKGSPTFDPFDADADLLHSTEKVIKTLQWNANEHMKICSHPERCNVGYATRKEIDRLRSYGTDVICFDYDAE